MSTKVGVNKLTVVHKDSSGVSIAFPDVCLTPGPPSPVPVPYPNIAKSGDTDKGTRSVTCDGNPIAVKGSVFKTSTGDEAGTNKGVASGKIQGKAEFVNYSFDVKFEGRNVARALDPMLHNDKNTPPAPVLQPPLVAVGQSPTDPDPEAPRLKVEWKHGD